MAGTSVPHLVDIALQPATGSDTDHTDRRHEARRDEQHVPTPCATQCVAGEQDARHYQERQDEEKSSSTASDQAGPIPVFALDRR